MSEITTNAPQSNPDVAGHDAEQRSPKPNGTASSRILDRRDPMRTARAMVRDLFIDKTGLLTLQHFRGDFWHFRNGGYVFVEDDGVTSAIWLYLEDAVHKQNGNGDSGPIEVPFKPNKGQVENILSALRAVCELSSRTDPPIWIKDGEKFPPPKEFLAVANGLLHLPSGELYSSTPNYFGLSVSNVLFDPLAQAERWMQFLTEVFRNDIETVKTVQEWLGYCLSHDTSLQKMLLMIGPKRGGKGTISRTLTALLGGTSIVANPTVGQFADEFGLEQLIGKPLAIISDARVGRKMDQAGFVERLLAISGEDAVSIPRKYRQHYNGRLPTRIMIQTNEVPYFSDSAAVLSTRFIVLKLTQSFLNMEDRELEGKLNTELSGILNWAIEGYRRLQRRGHFVQPKSAETTIETLENLSSPIMAFVDEKCVLGANYRVETKRLFELWCRWCAEKREEAGKAESFGSSLLAVYEGEIEKVQQRIGGGERRRFYAGIAIRP